MPVAHCPLCTAPFGDSWIRLAQTTLRHDPSPTHICPKCTLSVTGHPRQGADSGYRARLCAPTTALVEDDRGRIRVANTRERAELEAMRLEDLAQALAAAGPESSGRVLHVGSRTGAFLAQARRELGVNPMALEPWRPWAEAAARKQLPVQDATLEALASPDRFDVIVEHDLLPLLADPRAHLAKIAAHLNPGGVALVEVPNLSQAVGASQEHLFSLERPLWFTARALVTACRQAGLAPFLLASGERLRVFARAAAPSKELPPGPGAQTVAQGVWGNDLRLELKRTLARAGATPESLAVAGRVHQRCATPGLRADVAVEIANACQRSGDLDQTAHWLAVSLKDRPDREVQATLVQLVVVRHQLRARDRAQGAVATGPAAYALAS